MDNILDLMIQATKEDRSRFFNKADVYAITGNLGLSTEQITDLVTLRQQWRDMTSLPEYPDIDWPLPLPEWFPNCEFASSWKKGHKAKWEEERRMMEELNANI
jgi:hypothetical protein